LIKNTNRVPLSAGVATVLAFLIGGYFFMLATSTNPATVGIVAQPKTIKKPQDLVGKTVGLVGRGDMNEYFFLTALERWGVDPKSITFLAIPGSQPRLVAVANGNIDATILAPPFTFEAEKLHLTTLADFTTSAEPFPQSGLVVRKEYVRRNRDTVKKILMAYIEAIHILKSDADKSTAIVKKYMRITDDAVAKRSFEYYSKLFSQPPLTDEKGVATVLKFLATQTEFPNAKNAKAADFFDNSLLLELQREGYLGRFK
jgi:ABC-type nitrate/sulfonate/bicarbonate transport system substrate-binding protein